MTTETWSKAELIALVQGKIVTSRSIIGEVLPTPDWLTAVAESELELTSAEFLDALHPDDQAAMLAKFAAASQLAGEPQQLPIRARLDEVARAGTATVLHLPEDSPAQGILLILELTTKLADQTPYGQSIVNQEARDWLMVTTGKDAIVRTIAGDSMRFLGFRPDEMIGHIMAEFFTTEDMSASIKMSLQLHKNPGRSYTSRRQFVRKDKSRVPVEASYINRVEYPDFEGPILNLFWDITDKVDDERELDRRSAELERSAREFQTLADEVPTPVFRCDECGTLTFRNRAWDFLLGEDAQVASIYSLIADSDRHALEKLLLAAGSAPGHDRHTIEVPDRTGERTWLIGLRSVGQGGNHIQVIGTIEDISGTVQLRSEARLDALTGVVNRGMADIEVARLDVERSGWTLVLFIDLDKFKWVNDTLGHDAGDEVLIEVAKRLSALARPADMVARWGGDEFLMLLQVSEGVDATLLADRLGEGIRKPMTVANEPHVQQATIGYQLVSPDESVAQAIRDADHDMLRRKKLTGRGAASPAPSETSAP